MGHGDPLLWPLLYEAIRSRLHDPDLIYPNDQLAIPRDVPRAETQARARTFYRTSVPD